MPYHLALLALSAFLSVFFLEANAQQDSSTHKHEIGFNTASPVGELFLQIDRELEDAFPVKVQSPFELCYKRRLKTNNFLRFSAGAWIQTNNHPSPYYYAKKINGHLILLGLGYEKRLMLDKHFALAFGVDVNLRTVDLWKLENDDYSARDSAGTLTLYKSITTIKHQLYALFLSPLVELRYHLNQRFALVGQARLRTGYQFGNREENTNTIEKPMPEYDKQYHTQYSQWLLQVNPMANIALYYSF